MEVDCFMLSNWSQDDDLFDCISQEMEADMAWSAVRQQCDKGFEALKVGWGGGGKGG